jgi:hypothetical protein
MCPPFAPAEDVNFRNKFACAEILILCRISRTLIQMGALQSAGSYLDRATAMFDECGVEKVPHAILKTHIDVTKGLLCFSTDQVSAVTVCSVFYVNS